MCQVSLTIWKTAVKYTVEYVDIWYGPVEDKPGGLAEKLLPLAAAGFTLDFLDASRGTGMLFVAPVKGVGQIRVARKTGLQKATMMRALRITGRDVSGLGAQLCQVLGEAGISFRALAAAVVGKKCSLCFAFDSTEDARKSKRVFRKSLPH